MTTFGIHTNAQGKPIADLIDAWRHADRLGYSWISISDHFPGSHGASSNEAVSTHTAMALTTERARCAVLCYCTGFRHPAVLTSAAVTIDHLSGGRAAIGLGSGSVRQDFEIYGFPYPSAKERTDKLEEAARCITSLLRDEVVDLDGTHFQLVGASHQPRPLQERLPVWLGVAGTRGLRIAAELADGWSANFLSPEVFADKLATLRQHCESIGRDSTEIQVSINLLLMLGTDPASLPEERRKVSLAGSVNEVLEQIETYAAAGAEQINFFLPHPFDLNGIEVLADAIGIKTS